MTDLLAGSSASIQPHSADIPDGMRQTSVLVTLGAWLLFATVALAPLPFGSNISAAIAFWCVVLGASLILLSESVYVLGSGQLALAALAVAVVAAYGLVLYEQVAQHPLLPAEPNPIWHRAEAALGTPLAPVSAIAHGQPWLDLGRPLVCVLALICGFLVGVKRRRARQLVKVIAYSGVLYALYGIISHLIDPTHVLWLYKRAYLESVTGTFINRNTAGAYFGSCAVVWSLLFWERARRAAPQGRLDWRAMGTRMLSGPPGEVVVAFAFFLVCLTAMFMTNSRAAAVLSLLAIIGGFICLFWRDLPRRTGILTALVGGGAVALVLLETFGAGVNARFDVQGLGTGGRLETYKSTLLMIGDHPWLGTGQGTFALAFPIYRGASGSIFGTWDMAHNTLLQIAAEMGIPIAVLVTVAWIAIMVTLVRGLVIRRKGILLPASALAVALLAVLHSLVDFSLQIPGYAIVVLSLVGAGLAQSFPDATSPRVSRGHQPT